MSTTYDLFTRWKVLKGFKSERQACLALGVSSGAVVHWKDGRNADVDLIQRMAKDLGENSDALIIQSIAEQKIGPSRKILEAMSKRVAAVACALVVLGGFSLYFNGLAYGISHNIVYIMYGFVLMAMMAFIGKTAWIANSTPRLA